VHIPRAAPAPVAGALILATAMPDGEWQRHVLAHDEKVRGGGDALYAHFTLARGPGNGVVALFAKVADEFATLWSAHVADGAPRGEPRRLAQGPAHAFAYVNGLRTGGFTTSLQGVVSGVTEAAPSGRIVIVGGRPPIRTRF
jgi:hypothetical protein